MERGLSLPVNERRTLAVCSIDAKGLKTREIRL